MRLIALTGGIACGKTTAGTYLSTKHHCTLIDSDQLSHEVQLPHRAGWREVVAHFGRSILNPDETIDRKKLGALVFNNPAELKALNRIVHPRVIRQLVINVIKAWLSRKEVVVLDIPLFFEGHLPKRYFHDVVVVAVDHGVQIERLISRSHVSLEDAEKRIAAQMPIEQKCRLGTVVVRNDGKQEEIERQLDDLVRKWKRGAMLTFLPDPLLIVIVAVAIVVLIVLCR
jgi:dephospho-CoA kinase